MIADTVTTNVFRASLRITSDCNNRCIFCAQDPRPVDPVDIESQLAGRRAQSDELTLTGGEPTLLPGLTSIVARARELGFRRIGIQTNGTRLNDAECAGELARAGLTDVHLSLHGTTAAAHDYHTGVPGSFVEIIGAMTSARAANLELIVATVVTRSNFRSLGAFPALLAERQASAWLLVMPHAAGRAHDGFDRIVPRLALSLPFALLAASLARKRGIPTWVRGAPRCLLGPYGGWALGGERRSYGEPCDRCAARADCAGVDPSYLERFGAEELRPLAEPAEHVAEPHELLSRAFVGTGPMLSAPGEPAVSSSAPARRSLPVLDRVRPATLEVPQGAKKRSGDELRRILPDLFSEGDD